MKLHLDITIETTEDFDIYTLDGALVLSMLENQVLRQSSTIRVGKKEYTLWKDMPFSFHGRLESVPDAAI